MSISGLILAGGLTAAAVWSLVSLQALHPVQLWTVPWALAADGYATRLLPYRFLSGGTVALALGATAAFAAGAILTGGRGSSKDHELRVEEAMLRRAACVSVMLAAVLLGAFLAQVATAYGVRAAFISSLTVRGAIGHGQFPLTIKFVYAALAATALSAIVAAAAPTRRQRRAWLAVAAACVGSLYFATGRATIVDGAVVAAIAYAVSRPRALRTRQLLGAGATAGLLALCVFIADGAVIGKTFSNDADLRSVPSVFVDHPALAGLALPYQYVSAPIPALDVQVRNSSTWGDGHGCAALEPVCSAIRRLGFAVPSVPRIRAFTAPPLSWNTYTALDVPLIDGGIALVLPIVALLGLLTGLVWRAAVARRLLGVVGYALGSVALITASGSFNFTAPHLWGAFLIVVAAIVAAQVGPRVPNILAVRRRRTPEPASAVDA